MLAAKTLEVVPERAVYIGDVENDVKAGKAAGMKVIIYGPQAVPGAYAWTAEFSQIPKLLQSVNQNII